MTVENPAKRKGGSPFFEPNIEPLLEYPYLGAMPESRDRLYFVFDSADKKPLMLTVRNHKDSDAKIIVIEAKHEQATF